MSQTPRMLPVALQRTRKGVYGWSTTSSFELTENRLLKVTTMKRSNGRLTTTAQVVRVDGGFEVYTPFSDYSTMLLSESPARVTEKAVEEQQVRALSAAVMLPVFFAVIKQYGAAVIPEAFREEYACYAGEQSPA